MAGESRSKLRVWDLPTRLFHWTLVMLVIVQIVSVELGPEWNKEYNWLTLHFWCDYAILALLLFRIAWLRRQHHGALRPFREGAGCHRLSARPAWPGRAEIGHNPVGGWMVVALILGLLVQIVTGLFATDTDMGYYAGPLAKLASDSFSSGATKIHHIWINLLYVMVALHVSASPFYLGGKRENLIIDDQRRQAGTGRRPGPAYLRQRTAGSLAAGRRGLRRLPDRARRRLNAKRPVARTGRSIVGAARMRSGGASYVGLLRAELRVAGATGLAGRAESRDERIHLARTRGRRHGVGGVRRGGIGSLEGRPLGPDHGQRLGVALVRALRMSLMCATVSSLILAAWATAPAVGPFASMMP